MAATISSFRTRFPEFSDSAIYPDARIDLFLNDAVDYIGTNEARWCNRYNKAQEYLAAHLLQAGTFTEAGDTSGKAGPVSGKTAGGVTVNRSVVAKDRSDGDDFLTTTSYGQQYLHLRNTCFAGVAIATK